MDGLRRYSAETSRLSIANVSSSAGNARIRSPGNRDSKALSLSTATPYEPNLSGVPAPTGLQLRVDGALTTQGPTGLDLGGGGRVAGTSAPGGIAIDFLNGRVLNVTPGWS
jgi:hypothetical protein